jgi:Aminoacyl-tRNA editing domain
MAEVDGKPVCVVVPSDREVSMKKLAAAFGGKTAKMMHRADAERLTGSGENPARSRHCIRFVTAELRVIDAVEKSSFLLVVAVFRLRCTAAIEAILIWVEFDAN